MTKKVPKKILRRERTFFVNLIKKCFYTPTPHPPPAHRLWGPGPPPPSTEIDRRADTMTLAHSSISNQNTSASSIRHSRALHSKLKLSYPDPSDHSPSPPERHVGLPTLTDTLSPSGIL